MKTSELIEHALDFAVAKCEGLSPFTDGISWIVDREGTYAQLPKYSTNWAQGGPIIERESISVRPRGNGWVAESFVPSKPGIECVGPTSLIAAMRCFVASCLGNEIEVPGELTTCEGCEE